MTDNNGHTVSLRDYFDSRFDSLEKLDDDRLRLDGERDRRYEERDRANKEAVKMALCSANRAAEKNDESLAEFKKSSNEWRKTVQDLIERTDKMVTKVDFERQHQVVLDRINELMGARSVQMGRDTALDAMASNRRLVTALVVTSVLSVVGMILHLVKLF